MVNMGKSVEREMFFGAKPEIFKLASELRKHSTEAEMILWEHLRNFRLKGYKFRRQHPIDIFIADFYCHKIRLIIELDGEVHFNDESREHDDGRTGELEKHGIKVIRFTNNQIIENLELVLEQITISLTELSAHSQEDLIPCPFSRVEKG